MKKLFKRSAIALVLILTMIAAVSIAVSANTGPIASVTVNGGAPTEYTTVDALYTAINRADGDVVATIYQDITFNTSVVAKDRLTLKAADGVTPTVTAKVVNKNGGSTAYKGAFVFASGSNKLTLSGINFVVEETTLPADASKGGTSLVMINASTEATAIGNGHTHNIIFDNVNVTSAGAIINEYNAGEYTNCNVTVNGGSFTATGDFIEASRSTRAEKFAFNLSVTGGATFNVAKIYSTPTAGTTDYITYGNDGAAKAAGFKFRVGATEGGKEDVVYFTAEQAAKDYADANNSIVVYALETGAVVYCTHADAANDGDHKCDTCTYVFENACADAATDGDHDCDDCGEEDITQHAGGTATCMSGAVCEECNEAYGNTDPTNHTRANTTVKDAVAPSCAPGYTGDTYCECGVKIADGTAIAATGNHSDAANDGDHKCDTCTYVFENACADAATDGDHDCDDCGEENITQHTGGTATCMAKKACSDCGAAYGDVDPANHTRANTTVKNAVAATCATAGYTGDTHCECGVKIADGTAIAATGEHDDAENDDDHKCDVCDYVFENACADEDNDYKCDECGEDCGEAPATTAPATTAPATTAPTTTAPTTTKAPETTEAPKTEVPNGCKGTVTVAGLALVAALGSCAIFVEKKRR